MKRFLWHLLVATVLISASNASKIKKKRCKRSPRPCGGNVGGGGFGGGGGGFGGGGSIERIVVTGQRLPSINLPSWIFTSNQGASNSRGGDGGGGGGAPVQTVVIVLKLKEGAKGEKVVLEVIKDVEAVLGSTNGLLLKIAYVESQFGTHPDTYQKGYPGGIFQVDLIGFKDTQNVLSHPALTSKFAKIQNAFNIDWSKATWKDLRKPLYSAIAARLLLSNKPGAIPTSLKGQAKYWKQHYNSYHPNAAGTVTKFESRWSSYLKSKQAPSGSGNAISGGGGRPISGRSGKFNRRRHGIYGTSWHEP